MKIEDVFIITIIIRYTEFKEILTARSHKFNNDYISYYKVNGLETRSYYVNIKGYLTAK